MLLAGLITCLVAVPASRDAGRQDPHDPLIFAPGMAVGSRLQIGANVTPADWTIKGKLTEPLIEDDGLKGFRILKVADPASASGKGSAERAEFGDVPADFDGATPVVTVFTQDGQRHRFTLDTGAVRSYMRASTAVAANFGRIAPLPLCLFLPADRWIHFRAEVDRSIAVLATPNPNFPYEGILGMNAAACLQLSIDYRHRKLRVRVSGNPLDSKVAAAELGLAANPAGLGRLVSIPMKRQDSGRFSIDLTLAGKSIPFEVDTGANLLGLPPPVLSALTLEKIGAGSVLVEAGAKALSKYVAPAASVGGINFLWPVIHEGVDPTAKLGGFGPSALPHRAVIIDYPGQRLYTVVPSENERVEQALGQLVAGVVRIVGKQAVMDMPDVFGATLPVLTKIQDRPTASVIADLRLLANGDAAARTRVLALYRELSAPHGHITVVRDGVDTTLEIGQG